MTTNKYDSMVERLEELKNTDEEKFIEEIKALSDEDFVGVYKEKSYAGTEVGIFGYFGNVYFNNEDIDEYLVDKNYVIGSLIVTDEMREQMEDGKNREIDRFLKAQEDGYFSEEKVNEIIRRISNEFVDSVESYESDCTENLYKLYQQYEDEIDAYFILEQRDRLIDELENELM